jgi:2-polyprenyl-3-methyl-5-hydroxy-6-metoxy-1,4-benzoquinol methylase
MTELSPYARHEFVDANSNDSWSNLFGFIPEGARVLDVGCSTGNFGEALERIKHCTVVGIDIFADDIAVARTRISRAEVRDATVAGALDDLGEFDVIIFADVLEHLVDARAALVACTPSLAEGGAVLYSIPNMAHLSVRLDLLEGRFGYTEVGILDRTHVHFHDREGVDALFADSGFDIADERSVSFPYPPKWIEDRLDRMGLTGSPAFDALLRSTEADVLQFVGRAVVSPAGLSATPHERHRTFPPEEISAYAAVIEAENQRLLIEVRDTQLALAALRSEALLHRHRGDSFEQQLAALQARVAELKSHPVRTVLGVLKRRLGGKR